MICLKVSLKHKIKGTTDQCDRWFPYGIYAFQKEKNFQVRNTWVRQSSASYEDWYFPKGTGEFIIYKLK